VISTPWHVERLVQPEQAVKVSTENEIEAAFSTLAKEQAGALLNEALDVRLWH
jgi:hypothetical protein